MNFNDYLKRINYEGSLEPTAKTLRDLQLAHLLSVPFENLSIHAKQPIILDYEKLFNKIVERKRGGFCYEVNGLFAALLRHLGFRVEMLSAEVANAKGGFGPAFDHLTLMVSLEDCWLADVGFGDSFTKPLLLDKRIEQIQGRFTYKIFPENEYFILKRRENESDWETQYRFTLQPFDFNDFAEMCRYHQTSPQSHFTRRKVCSLATREGRITLSEMRLIKTSEKGEKSEIVLKNQSEYQTILRETFGIVV